MCIASHELSLVFYVKLLVFYKKQTYFEPKNKPWGSNLSDLSHKGSPMIDRRHSFMGHTLLSHYIILAGHFILKHRISLLKHRYEIIKYKILCTLKPGFTKKVPKTLPGQNMCSKFLVHQCPNS